MSNELTDEQLYERLPVDEGDLFRVKPTYTERMGLEFVVMRRYSLRDEFMPIATIPHNFSHYDLVTLRDTIDGMLESYNAACAGKVFQQMGQKWVEPAEATVA